MSVVISEYGYQVPADPTARMRSTIAHRNMPTNEQMPAVSNRVGIRAVSRYRSRVGIPIRTDLNRNRIRFPIRSCIPLGSSNGFGGGGVSKKKSDWNQQLPRGRWRRGKFLARGLREVKICRSDGYLTEQGQTTALIPTAWRFIFFDTSHGSVGNGVPSHVSVYPGRLLQVAIAELVAQTQVHVGT